MAGEVRAIRREAARLEDLHACIDEALSRGATAGFLVVAYPEGKGPAGGDWEAWGTDGMSAAERAFIYQQLIIIEVADQGYGKED